MRSRISSWKSASYTNLSKIAERSAHDTPWRTVCPLTSVLSSPTETHFEIIMPGHSVVTTHEVHRVLRRPRKILILECTS